MSLYGALFSGVSGLSSQASAMGAIADNVTNVNTIAYKGTSVKFQTLITKQVSSTKYAPGGVQSKPRHENDQQGLLQATTSSQDVGMSGNGFMVVNSVALPSSQSGGLFGYTRAGSFKADKSGYLQNAGGFYLQGWPMTATDNSASAVPTHVTIENNTFMKAYKNTDGTFHYINQNIVSDTELRPLNLNTIGGTATSTSRIAIGVNLPSGDAVYDSSATNSTGIHVTNVLMYDSLGNTSNTNFTWTKTATNQWKIAASPPSGTSVIQIQNATATNSNPDPYYAAGQLEFTGTFTSSTLTALNSDTFSVNTGTARTLTFSTSGTAFADFAISSNNQTISTAAGTMTLTAGSGTPYSMLAAGDKLVVTNTDTSAVGRLPQGIYTVSAIGGGGANITFNAYTKLDGTGSTTPDVATDGTLTTTAGATTAGNIAIGQAATIRIGAATSFSDIITQMARCLGSNVVDTRFTADTVNNRVLITQSDPSASSNTPVPSGDVIIGATAALNATANDGLRTYLKTAAGTASGTGAFTVPDLSTTSNYYDNPAITFNGDGTPSAINVNQLRASWANGAQDMVGGTGNSSLVSLFLGNLNQADGVTQFAGSYQITYLTQNGAKFGNFSGISIGTNGVVTALFDNGVRRPVFQIPIATFVNPNGLDSVTGNTFIETETSGQYTLRKAGEAGAGQTSQASLEASTVDLGEEFTVMITTQRAYSASAKIITTADEMLDELVRIKR